MGSSVPTLPHQRAREKLRRYSAELRQIDWERVCHVYDRMVQ